jgi:hypothetical protein
MRFMQRLSHAFRNKPSISNSPAHLPTRMSPGDLMGDVNRLLYGMSAQDEAIARQILAMAGDAVLVEQDTFGIDRKNNPRYLRRGQEVKLSKNPLTFNLEGEARICILDESDNYLSMRLSDFIHDIHANPKRLAHEGIS